MMQFGYNNRRLRLVKDILFVALGVWLLTTGRFFAIVLGVFALLWYGRDAWFQIKALWQEKHYKDPRQEPDIKTGAPKDDKITLTTDAKEVEYRKE